MKSFSALRRWKQSVEEYVRELLYHPPKDKKAACVAFVFRALSIVFGGIVFSREKLYKNRLLKDHPLGCRVIVVGNLTVGGTGKTPVVEKLARLLQNRGRKVAILSRGYKSKAEPWWKKSWHWLIHADPCPPKVVSDGVRCLLPYETAGYEPLLLAKNLPGVCVVVDKDRVKAGQYAIEKFGCDLLLLDDGFQYFRLKGASYIVLIDATNPFGNGHILPRGILREPMNRLRRAQFIVFTKSDRVAAADLKNLEQRVRCHNEKAPIFFCKHVPKYLQAVNGIERLELSSLNGQKVAALSGIASPRSFEQSLEDNGAQVVYMKHFLDHHGYSEGDLIEFFAEAKHVGVECVITTEKDAVRISETSFELPFYFLRMEIEWMGGEDPFERILEQLSVRTA
ncbi:MAG: tetraacyldisaccharide 4'-kinase [Opitutales bacterium]|nr:tetraacyldisaccharide 4'-kinase [Opitutales bacterium]